MTYAVTYASTLVAFVLADFIWLSTMGPRLYRPTLGDILLADPKWPAIVAFYLIYPAGLALFAVLPALKTNDMRSAALVGAAFGFFTYATYDLTNQATLRNWTTTVTLLDIAWGCAIGAFAASCAFWVARKFS